MNMPLFYLKLMLYYDFITQVGVSLHAVCGKVAGYSVLS